MLGKSRKAEIQIRTGRQINDKMVWKYVMHG